MELSAWGQLVMKHYGKEVFEKKSIEEQKLIDGVCPCDDTSAPYDTNLWPSHYQSGWDNETLKNYRKGQSDEEIDWNVFQ